MVTVKIKQVDELTHIMMKRSLMEILKGFFEYPGILLTSIFTLFSLMLYEIVKTSPTTGGTIITSDKMMYIAYFLIILILYSFVRFPQPNTTAFLGKYSLTINQKLKGIKNEYGEIIRYNQHTSFLFDNDSLFIINPLKKNTSKYRLEILRWYNFQEKTRSKFVKIVIDTLITLMKND